MSPLTVADLIIKRLQSYQVTHIFGYPGGQLTPLYDALFRVDSPRHILARDEQGAAFMADGYARATGKPGVCLAVCGPGVLNALTPLATAYTDSIPMLLISGQIYKKGAGLRSGYYHENEQLRACETCVKWLARIENTEEIIDNVDEAFQQMTSGRPGPVVLEIPLDVLREEVPSVELPALPKSSTPLAPTEHEIDKLVTLIDSWQRPILMVGGGVITANAESQLQQLAERLGAPVFHTAMGKSALSSAHPLLAGMCWQVATSDLTGMEQNFSPQLRESDGMLAIGCRFSQLGTGNWTAPYPKSLAHIDIDAEEIGRHYPATIGLQADARIALEMLLDALPAESRQAWTDAKRRGVEEMWKLEGRDFITPIRRALPEDAILIPDVTRLAYLMMVEMPIYQPRTFLHPAGYVTMGYGIPAALGARTAYSERPIVTIVGDGCFMMTALELATSAQEKLPIVVVLMNDGSLTLIKALQQRRFGERYIGVDLHNPDFALFAQSFGVQHQAVRTGEELEESLREAIKQPVTTLIEVKL